MYNNDAKKCLTGEVRCSYEYLKTPQAPPVDASGTPNGKPKYGFTLLIPKSDEATKKDLESAITAAYEEAVTKVFNGARPACPQLIWDGDGLRKSGVPFGAECKGHWVMTAKSVRKPDVLEIRTDPNGRSFLAEVAPQDIYSGMYCRATVHFYAFSQKTSKGIGCGLDNVLKTHDGEPLSGGTSGTEDFGGMVSAPADSALQTQPGPSSNIPF